MSKSVKKEILASEYSSEQVLAVNTTGYGIAKCMAIVLFFCWLGTVLTPLGFAFQNGLRYFLKNH